MTEQEQDQLLATNLYSKMPQPALQRLAYAIAKSLSVDHGIEIDGRQVDWAMDRWIDKNREKQR